jgi:hypothetical protein
MVRPFSIFSFLGVTVTYWISYPPKPVCLTGVMLHPDSGSLSPSLRRIRVRVRTSFPLLVADHGTRREATHGYP